MQTIHHQRSAGALMTKNVPVVQLTATLKDVEKLLFQKTKTFETINYVYVVDEAGHLQGAISVKEIFRRPKNTPVKKFILRDVVSTTQTTDQEHVALMAIKHNIKAIPVVDKNGKFLGIVPSDKILEVLHNKSIEDILRSAGIKTNHSNGYDLMRASAFVHFKKRFPWLLFGLCGGIFAAIIVNYFETSLKEEILLASFIPTVVYMADAVGSQTQTIFIRSLALHHLLDGKRYMFRELKVSFLLAIVLSMFIALVVLLWKGSFLMGMILASSIFSTILAASVIAVLLPLAFLKFRSDPAIASGPFATIIRDLLSVLIYFSIAEIML